MWPKFEMSTCKAWTGHIDESLLGIRDIIIGGLFFIFLKCLRIIWTPWFLINETSALWMTFETWRLSCDTSSSNLKNPWKANKKTARSSMMMLLSVAEWGYADRILSKIGFVIGILLSGDLFKFWAPLINLRTRKCWVGSGTSQILWM